MNFKIILLIVVFGLFSNLAAQADNTEDLMNFIHETVRSRREFILSDRFFELVKRDHAGDRSNPLTESEEDELMALHLSLMSGIKVDTPDKVRTVGNRLSFAAKADFERLYGMTIFRSTELQKFYDRMLELSSAVKSQRTEEGRAFNQELTTLLDDYKVLLTPNNQKKLVKLEREKRLFAINMLIADFSQHEQETELEIPSKVSEYIKPTSVLKPELALTAMQSLVGNPKNSMLLPIYLKIIATESGASNDKNENKNDIKSNPSKIFSMVFQKIRKNLETERSLLSEANFNSKNCQSDDQKITVEFAKKEAALAQLEKLVEKFRDVAFNRAIRMNMPNLPLPERLNLVQSHEQVMAVLHEDLLPELVAFYAVSEDNLNAAKSKLQDSKRKLLEAKMELPMAIPAEIAGTLKTEPPKVIQSEMSEIKAVLQPVAEELDQSKTTSEVTVSAKKLKPKKKSVPSAQLQSNEPPAKAPVNTVAKIDPNVEAAFKSYRLKAELTRQQRFEEEMRNRMTGNALKYLEELFAKKASLRFSELKTLVTALGGNLDGKGSHRKIVIPGAILELGDLPEEESDSESASSAESKPAKNDSKKNTGRKKSNVSLKSQLRKREVDRKAKNQQKVKDELEQQKASEVSETKPAGGSFDAHGKSHKGALPKTAIKQIRAAFRKAGIVPEIFEDKPANESGNNTNVR